MSSTGTKGPPAWAAGCGHVEAHLSRFWFEPGLKGEGISNDPLVPVQEPGLKALMNRDKKAGFLLVCGVPWRNTKSQQSTLPSSRTCKNNVVTSVRTSDGDIDDF